MSDKDIRPGDIWIDEDGDYNFILEPTNDIYYPGMRWDVVLYYNSTIGQYDDEFHGAFRQDSALVTLVYRQDDEPFLRPAGGFITRDSGKREERPSGYVRDTQEGKPRFDLIFPENVPYRAQMVTRLADLLARGADKYESRNWERANDVESLDRFKSSAMRHLIQWLTGETDEDHAAAVVYNVLAYESTDWKMKNLEDFDL